jgi:uracil-DNA glycosylase
METQQIYSRDPNTVTLHLARWTWKVKGRDIVCEDVVTPRLPFHYKTGISIEYIKRRALRSAGMTPEAIKKLWGNTIPDPYEVRIFEDKKAGDSFLTIQQYMEETPAKKETVYVKTCPIWNEVIQREVEKPYYQELVKFLREDLKKFEVYPRPSETFNALALCPFSLTRVVIIGQDPYHTPNTAHGLSFSSKQANTPPSLHNIFKEAYSDLELGKNGDRFQDVFNVNDLSNWARQGVLLLNRVLTVRKGTPESHEGKGWETFTKEIVLKLNETHKPIVFMLWGKKAQQVKELISPRHLILEAAHPSPYSAERGFFGCRHFSQANAFIKDHYAKIIVWANYNGIQQY